MYKICSELNYFIDERINNNFSKLKNAKDYKRLHKKYVKLLSEFNSKLSTEEKSKLDNILSLLNLINSKEISFSYIIGLTDGTKLYK